MLGMVNHALQEMVEQRLGEDAWQEIRREAGSDDEVFIIMKQYPDELTYRLAASVAARMGVPLPDALRAFGHHWMSYAERQPWGKVLHSMASNVRELLPALDALHARIAMAFPGVRMPRFRTEPDPDGTGVLVHYMSDREGLAPFVHGVLEGIGAMFGEMIEVSPVALRSDGADHDVFRVAFPAGG
jgi:hypothetical protein